MLYQLLLPFRLLFARFQNGRRPLFLGGRRVWFGRFSYGLRIGGFFFWVIVIRATIVFRLSIVTTYGENFRRLYLRFPIICLFWCRSLIQCIRILCKTLPFLVVFMCHLKLTDAINLGQICLICMHSEAWRLRVIICRSSSIWLCGLKVVRSLILLDKNLVSCLILAIYFHEGRPYVVVVLFYSSCWSLSRLLPGVNIVWRNACGSNKLFIASSRTRISLFTRIHHIISINCKILQAFTIV